MLHNDTLQALLTYNKCLKDKQIATKEHKCPNKILLIKEMKSLKKKTDCTSEDCHNKPDKENETELQ